MKSIKEIITALKKKSVHNLCTIKQYCCGELLKSGTVISQDKNGNKKDSYFIAKWWHTTLPGLNSLSHGMNPSLSIWTWWYPFCNFAWSWSFFMKLYGRSLTTYGNGDSTGWVWIFCGDYVFKGLQVKFLYIFSFCCLFFMTPLLLLTWRQYERFYETFFFHNCVLIVSKEDLKQTLELFLFFKK